MEDILTYVREKISCPQFGDNHCGEWGALPLRQRAIIKMLLDYSVGQEEVINRQKAEIKRLKGCITGGENMNVRLINANSLISRVARHISVAGKEKIVEMIVEEPTVDAGMWIATSERLPDVYGVYLGVASGTCGNIQFKDAIMFVEYDPDKEEWWLSSDCPDCHNLNISFWMDIPPAPPHLTV